MSSLVLGLLSFMTGFPSEPMLTESDKAVFQVLFDGIFYKNKARILIADKNRTSKPNNPLLLSRLRLMKAKPQMPLSMIEMHTRRNERAISLTSFEPRQWHAFKSMSAIESVVGPRHSNWVKFHKTYPNTSGFVRLMLPSYNEAGDMALTYLESYAGDKSSFGAVYQLIKKNGRWSVANQLGGWVE